MAELVDAATQYGDYAGCVQLDDETRAILKRVAKRAALPSSLLPIGLGVSATLSAGNVHSFRLVVYAIKRSDAATEGELQIYAKKRKIIPVVAAVAAIDTSELKGLLLETTKETTLFIASRAIEKKQMKVTRFIYPADKAGKPAKSPSAAASLQQAIAAAERKGQTQYAIAKAAGMPQSQVRRVASGESIPTLDTAERIAKAIGCEIRIC